MGVALRLGNLLRLAMFAEVNVAVEQLEWLVARLGVADGPLSD
jgi:hypothetical protein